MDIRTRLICIGLVPFCVAAASAQSLGPRVTATQVLRLGSVDGGPGTTFFRVADARFTPGGGLAVLDGGDQVVKRFDRDGRLLHTFGGSGEGPAEFNSASLLEVRGDTVRVLDIDLRKLADFAADGRLIGTRRIGYSVSALGFPESFVTRSDGGLYAVGVSGCGFPRRPDDNYRGVFAFGPDGAVSDTLERGRIRNALPAYSSTPRGSQCTVFPWPFAPGPVLTFDPAGGAVRSPGDAYEVQWLDPTLRRVTRMVRYPGPVRRISAAERREFGRLLDARKNLSRELREAVEAAADSAGQSEVWPAVAALRPAGPGVVWARRGHPIGAREQEWDVLSGGRHVRVVALPAALRVFDVSGQRVVGVITDELDVEYVVVYVVPGGQ